MAAVFRGFVFVLVLWSAWAGGGGGDTAGSGDGPGKRKPPWEKVLEESRKKDKDGGGHGKRAPTASGSDATGSDATEPVSKKRPKTVVAAMAADKLAADKLVESKGPSPVVLKAKPKAAASCLQPATNNTNSNNQEQQSQQQQQQQPSNEDVIRIIRESEARVSEKIRMLHLAMVHAMAKFYHTTAASSSGGSGLDTGALPVGQPLGKGSGKLPHALPVGQPLLQRPPFNGTQQHREL